MSRVAEIVALRELGLNIGQVVRVLEGDATSLETALAAHQANIEDRLHQLTDIAEKVRRVRTALANGKTSATGDVAMLVKPAATIAVALDQP